jgi:N-acetylglucosaminyldiphosphoundecaprenol N-acetyl-beta-D-mannosaminyltransferase
MVTSGKAGAVDILGVPIGILDMPKAVDLIGSWIDGSEKRGRYVVVADAYNVMLAKQDPKHLEALVGADVVTPDGMPLVWVSWLRGVKETRRVSGPDLLPEVCARSNETGWRHYFYGGAEGVGETLAGKLKDKNPKLQIAGIECPPFRVLSADEKEAVIQRIKASKADIVWVGLGCPKQEAWMHEHVGRLDGVVLIGVGAAFDFLSGRIARAPVWMQRNGLEWLHRLASEPRRLWRRYLISAPRFAVLTLAETLAIRRAQSRG